MTDTLVPLCIDCEHYLKRWWYSEAMCTHSRVDVPAKRDVVSGKIIRKATVTVYSCKTERAEFKSPFRCGYFGKNFKKKAGK